MTFLEIYTLNLAEITSSDTEAVFPSPRRNFRFAKRDGITKSVDALSAYGLGRGIDSNVLNFLNSPGYNKTD
jgi:hypothetical protein